MITSPTQRWAEAASALLADIASSQSEVIETAAQWCADTIAAGNRAHTFGSGHSRIPVEEMFPRYGSFPGFHGIVELSLTTYSGVSGANGLLQAMFIERQPGFADVILQNQDLRDGECLFVFSVSGSNAVALEMIEGASARGLQTIAVTSVAHCDLARSRGSRTIADAADLVIDLRIPLGDALVDLGSTRVGPSSTLAYVAVVNLVKVRTAELLHERGALPPVISHASVVGADASTASLSDAVADHARRERGRA